MPYDLDAFLGWVAALNEAMAAGCPCVVAATGAAPRRATVRR